MCLLASCVISLHIEGVHSSSNVVAESEKAPMHFMLVTM